MRGSETQLPANYYCILADDIQEKRTNEGANVVMC